MRSPATTGTPTSSGSRSTARRATDVALYAAVVLGAQGLLGTREPPDAVVAGSTLLAAAMVRPLHARVQDRVDRRFNRSRVGAAAAVHGFGRRLRDEVDLDSIEDELRAVVATTLAPRLVSTWRPSRHETAVEQ